MIPYSMDYLQRHLRVCIYARVSTDHEAQLSALENQLDWYKPLLGIHPEWELVEMYVDEGITGTSAEKRPEFMRMIADAKKKKFDMIITREVSRFARNTVDTLQYTRMLKEHGVEVYFINDGIKTFDGDGELRLTIMATLAQDESRKTSIRVKSGQQTSMNNGVVYGNGNILGYDRVGKDMVINPEQARTVRLIFDMYLSGCGLVKIKDELERRECKTSLGKDKWFPTVISHVLKNSFYCGIMTYHKEYVPDYLKQKKVKNYGEIELTQVQGKHEPIITVEEFERVQRIMETKINKMPYLNKGNQKGKKPRTTVWGKLLICSCGNTFSMRRWGRPDRTPGNAYQCYKARHTGSLESRRRKGLPLDDICESPMIPEWRLQMMANLIFRKYLSQKDKVLSLANSILEAHIDDAEEKENNEALLNAKQTELARLQKKLDAYIEMRAEGDLSQDMYRAKLDEIRPKIQRLQEEIENLSVEREPKEVKDYREKLTILQYALEQYTRPEEGQDVPESVIEAFVVKIVVSKDGFDWYLRFDGDPNEPLHCQLSGKRKNNTKIMIAGELSPAIHNSTTGCHQGLIA
jgi:DNA invertase Pin-like site-specific DNA recombinase